MPRRGAALGRAGPGRGEAAGGRGATRSAVSAEMALVRGGGGAAPDRTGPGGRGSSPPLGPLRGLLPSEGDAPATPRKAAAGVLQPRVSQEKEQPDCPSCPEDLLQRRINPVRSDPDSCQWDHRIVAGKIQEQDDAWKNVTYGGAGNSLLLGNRLVCVRLPCPDGWCR
ncbi:uncharacterized protein LOC121075423 isoform X4 [Cygnus olor]|uniref:uncharacterized protein LOC121075423 isoform X4 n=1 Tax=Cygnus olor TaxID=8869 RepID=UPI001ADE4F5A|nr:uncharacterized protein LOC121075423 isoform X4 [Cygnus olor]